MYTFLLTILALTTRHATQRNTIHAKIGTYPGITVENCGLTQYSEVYNEVCFKWHRTIKAQRRDKMLANIKNGRNAKPAEFPWSVRLTVETTGMRCTGFLINSDWVVTCAHCFDRNKTKTDHIFVTLGVTNLKTDNNYDTVGCDKLILAPKEHDIALIKLKRPIKLTQSINAVCLPQKRLINFEKELAIMSGWGAVDENVPNEDNLKAGQISLNDYRHLEDQYLIKASVGQSDPFGCNGDSGAPVVQYVNGRAVVVGMYNGKRLPPNEKRDCIAGTLNIVRMSFYIDWIINRINTHCNASMQDFETLTDVTSLLQFPNCKGTSTAEIDSTVFHDGKKSLKVTGKSGYCNHIFVAPLTGLCVGPTLYVRVWIRHTTELPAAHITFISMHDNSDGKDLRIGGQNQALQWNRESDDATLPEQSPNGVALSKPLPTGKWVCLEYKITQSGTAQTWLDGTEVAGLHAGNKVKDIDSQWLSKAWNPKLTDLRVGWEAYGEGDDTLWFDDIATGNSKIGC